MVIKIGRQDLTFKVVLAVPEQILFIRSVSETIRVTVGMEVMYVLDMARQTIGLESILRWVHRVSIIVPLLIPIAHLSGVSLLVPPLGNTQTGSMYFSPDRIRNVLQIWSLVHDKFTIYMFVLC